MEKREILRTENLKKYFSVKGGENFKGSGWNFHYSA